VKTIATIVNTSSPMNDYRKYFTSFIRSHYPEEGERLIARTDQHYRIISRDVLFAKTSKNPIDRRLDFSAYFLALIKTLDERGETFSKIREICLQITTAYVQPKNRIQAFFKRLLPRLITTGMGQVLIKSFHKRVSVNTHPDGFVAHILTDRQETFGLGYGFNILECGICKLFQKHHYAKYATILCEVDEITSGLAGLQLIRTGTIARGAEKCDFRFKLQRKDHKQSSIE
jgi:hypothetical protein